MHRWVSSSKSGDTTSPPNATPRELTRGFVGHPSFTEPLNANFLRSVPVPNQGGRPATRLS